MHEKQKNLFTAEDAEENDKNKIEVKIH